MSPTRENGVAGSPHNQGFTAGAVHPLRAGPLQAATHSNGRLTRVAGGVWSVTVISFAGIALATPTRTRAGKQVLQTYQASHARASRAPLDHELLLAVALSGAVVLSGTAYASIYAASRTMNGGGGCGGGGGGCGGGGGGGGCGGCS